MNKTLEELKELGINIEVVKDETKKTISTIKLNGKTITNGMVIPRTQGFLEGLLYAVKNLK